MKKRNFPLLLSCLLLCFSFKGNSQTFSGGGGSIMTVTDTSRFDINVSGLSPSTMNYSFGLESVTININHDKDNDIDCFLAAPDGTLIMLTTDNGSSGNNYTNTVFRNDASASISGGSAPFSGTFLPEGNLYSVNNGQNGNGTWQLRVIDDSNNGTSGSVVSWSITFGNDPARVFVFSESNLPIVVINTNGQTISDSPKIICDMGIIDNGSGHRNHLTDPHNDYNGKIGIEFRGSSSQQFPKKPYGFETRNSTGQVNENHSLLGMPLEHDWILSANYSDKSLMRNVLAYRLSQDMGHYATRAHYVELVINGQHKGIYILSEKIKRDSKRVDIASLHVSENTYPDVTGGYIFMVDKTTSGTGAGWTSNYLPVSHSNGQTIDFQYRYPSPDSITNPQKAYLQSYVDSFESALAGSNFRDSVLGYSKFIANKSFTDYFFVNEISKNVDGYRLSTFLYKDKLKPIHIGPVWDYDIAFGNANYCGGNDSTGWAYQFPCTNDGYQVPFWWQRMMQDSNFTNQLKCRWINFKSSVLNTQHIYPIMDSIAAYLNESQEWNFDLWPILGVYVWPNPSPYPTTYAGEVQNLKNWVNKRINWIDANLPGHCSCQLSVNEQNVTCAGACDGQAVALGTSPYQKTYTWDDGTVSNTIQNLCPGTYGVSFEDAVGCVRTSSITITDPAPLVINSSSTNTNCSGSGCNGSATVTVSGGSNPYSYDWSGGQTSASVSGLCAGTHSVVITDARGCSDSVEVDINNPVAPTLSIASQQNVSCHGRNDGSATVTFFGGTSPVTYSWPSLGVSGNSISNRPAGTYQVTITDANGCQDNLSVNISEPPALTSTASGTDPVCFQGTNGSAAVTASGGITPYQYSWAPSGGNNANANQLSAGNYSVIVTDANGCATTASVSLSAPSQITTTFSSVDVSCFGNSDGSAVVHAIGGTPGYLYLWTPSGNTDSTVTGLNTGNYSVRITDMNGCSRTASLTINGPAQFSLNMSSTQANCTGQSGTATVIANGGTQPYTYGWSPAGGNLSTASGLTAGTYTVTVTDANLCSSTASVSVASASGISTSIVTQNDVPCYGAVNGSATIQATGGVPPYSYSWSPAGGTNAVATNLAAGTYYITVQDANACAGIQQVIILQPTQIDVAISSSTLSCYGGNDGSISTIVTGGSPGYTYQWTPSLGSGPALTNIPAGNYSLRVSDSHGCSSIHVIPITEPSEISIAMNPTNANCGFLNGSAAAVVTGGTGAYSYHWSPNGETTSSISSLDTGVYTLSVQDGNGCIKVSSVHIQNSNPPLLSIASQDDITCNGGSDGAVTLTANGGTRPFTYSWSAGISFDSVASGLEAGVYAVVVTDVLGCRDSMGIIIDEPGNLATLMITNNSTCYGADDGFIIAEVGGGTQPYTYEWTPGAQMTDTASNLSPGTYSVEVTDLHGCTSSASASIIEPPQLVTLLQITNSSCFGSCSGSASIQITGGVQPYSASWCNGEDSFSATELCAASCEVNVMDGNGCTENIPFVINEPDSIQTIISTTNAACQSCSDGSASVLVSGGVAPYVIEWFPGGQSADSIFNLTPGLYEVCITDANLCSRCDSFSISDSTIGINEIPLLQITSVFPNPLDAEAIFSIQLMKRLRIKIEIYDLQGQVVEVIKSGTFGVGEHNIPFDARKLPSGMYFYRIISEAKTVSGKLIIEH